MKNLIIGASDNLSWEVLSPWACSLANSGFDGDTVLLLYRCPDRAVLEECKRLNITVKQIHCDENGKPIEHHKGGLYSQSHKLRNFHVWQYLIENPHYRFVALTDTSDVVFQNNPEDFFRLYEREPPSVYFPSEAVLIEDEKWVSELILKYFGQTIHEKVKGLVSCNSGTMFGTLHEVRDLMLHMFLVGRSVDAIGIDQPVANVLATLLPYVKRLPMGSGWACHAGTVLDSRVAHYPLVEMRPTMVGGLACFDGHPFVIFHQYTRIPALAKEIRAIYSNIEIHKIQAQPTLRSGSYPRERTALGIFKALLRRVIGKIYKSSI